MDIKDEKIMVTGGAGFLGNHVVAVLRATAKTGFDEGLRKTIEWYNAQHDHGPSDTA